MVEQPTVIFGQTQSGKTYRAFHLWSVHPGPAIFCDIQWRSYLPGTHYARTLEDVVGILAGASRESLSSGPKICWRLDSYDNFATLVDYLLTVHRGWHERGTPLPTVAIFMDEAWRVAGRGADENNPAVRVFTEGFQHRIIGVALSQWVSQMAHLIPGQAYQTYVFDLWERDLELLRSDYRMEVPDKAWLGDYHYWRYDGDWWKGNEGGLEEKHGEPEAPPVPVVPDGKERDGEAEAPVPERPTGEVRGDGVDVPELRTYSEKLAGSESKKLRTFK